MVDLAACGGAEPPKAAPRAPDDAAAAGAATRLAISRSGEPPPGEPPPGESRSGEPRPGEPPARELRAGVEADERGADPRSTPRSAPDAPQPSRARAAALPAAPGSVRPGPDGFLSTLVLVARHRQPLAASAELSLTLSAPGARPVASPSAVFDVGRLAGVERRHRAVYLGLELRAEARQALTLMVGIRGKARVWLDRDVLGEAESLDRFRRDRLLCRLDVAAGVHQLVLRLERPPQGRFAASLRWLGPSFGPGTGRVALGLGAEPTDAADLARRSVRVEERRAWGDDGPQASVLADRPGGGVEQPVPVRVGERTRMLAPAGPAEAVFRFPLSRGAGSLPRQADVDGMRVEIGRHAELDRRSLIAAARLADLLETAPADARAPIAWRRDELLRVIRARDFDRRWRGWLVRESQRIARAIERGRHPFAPLRGYARMAFFSKLDGTAQPYELFVPPAYRAHRRRQRKREWPLLVTLHGISGNAGDYFRNTFGLPRDYDRGESLVAHGRHGEAPVAGPMFVIAPTGRGKAMYRHAGEVDVIEAMDDVRRRFRIDPRRIYITGGSMGGTGAAYLPFRHPDLFAAAAPLAGYHDQRVRQDTRHAGLSEVERFLQARRSDVDWAENALHLPMLLVRGTRDRPLAWTRRLAARLSALGYRYEHREPDLGHNVWNETYREGAIFEYFARFRRPVHPRRVRLRTARERTASAYWVRIDEREAPDRFAEVDARLRDDTIELRASGVRALTLSPPAELVDGPTLTLRVGGHTLRGAPPLRLVRGERGRFRLAEASPTRQKQAGVSGPIRDVYHEPLTFVVGTQDPAHTWINRRVAAHWARPRGWLVDYPVVDDVALRPRDWQERTLVLVGPPASNAALRRIADRLPLRFRPDGIELGNRVYRGAEVGAAFVARNPLAPGKSVLVLAGVNPLGTWHALSLPDILPDYVVYDEQVAPARDQWACGGTGCRYRAHGFFDADWQVPHLHEGALQ